MKIYVFGNPLVSEDSLPLRLLSPLQDKFAQIHFIAVDPNENFPPKSERNLIILDVVKELSDVSLFDYSDLANIEKTPISPHDYDLLLHLLLLKKMKRINKVRIIGIPPKNVSKNILLADVSKLIGDLLFTFTSTSLSGNGKRRTYRDQRRG
jgi:Ni,Fe-hydrogenase maturation factor